MPLNHELEASSKKKIMVIKSHFLLRIVIREYTKKRPHEPVTLKQSAKIGPMNFYESTVYFIDI